jgi:transposase
VRGELLSGVERRRRWSAREKAAVARASWEPGACVADVARRFEVTRQQVYDWRAAARRGEFAGLEASAGFVEVIAAPAFFCFRGRRGDRLKLLYWDGQGLCLYYKVLEKGRFPWPSPADGAAVRLTSAQLAMLWEGIDWRRPA